MPRPRRPLDGEHERLVRRDSTQGIAKPGVLDEQARLDSARSSSTVRSNELVEDGRAPSTFELSLNASAWYAAPGPATTSSDA